MRVSAHVFPTPSRHALSYACAYSPGHPSGPSVRLFIRNILHSNTEIKPTETEHIIAGASHKFPYALVLGFPQRMWTEAIASVVHFTLSLVLVMQNNAHVLCCCCCCCPVTFYTHHVQTPADSLFTPELFANKKNYIMPAQSRKWPPLRAHGITCDTRADRIFIPGMAGLHKRPLMCCVRQC